ncbi:MAG TPA: hypothetical protein VIK35_09095 [Verrucomicrobiae bacterium]
MSDALDNPHDPPGFEADGRPVPIVEPDIYFDDPPDDDADTNASRFELVQTLDLLLVGAHNREEIAERVLVLSMLLKRPAAPKSMTQFALWMDVSRTTAQRKMASIIQCLQAQISFCGHGRALVDGQHKFAANAAGTKPG